MICIVCCTNRCIRYTWVCDRCYRQRRPRGSPRPKPPRPDDDLPAGSLLAELRRRAELGLPLFEGRRNDR